MRIHLLAIAGVVLGTGCPSTKGTTGTSTTDNTVATDDPVVAEEPVEMTAGASCNVPDRGMCLEFPDDMLADGRKICDDAGGSWSETVPCTRSNQLGLCTNPVRGNDARLYLYSPTWSTAEEAGAEMCTDEDDVFEPAY